MARRVIISVTNDLSFDQRVHRVAVSLVEMGFEVWLVGRRLRASQPLDDRPYKTIRLGFGVEEGKLFYLFYALKMTWWLLWQKVDVLLSNDMDTLLPNILIGKLRGKPVIYDSHEYWTEVPELLNRPRTRAVWHWLERRLFPRVTAAYTVNESIAAAYRAAYKLPVAVVRNLPVRKPMPEPQPKSKRLIYQGTLNVGRGIELMIAAMAHLPEYELVIAGFGRTEADLRALAATQPHADRIQFTGFLRPEALRTHTDTALLGMSLEEDLGASYHFALPNKLFDYIQAGLPVLVSDLPEMARVVHDHGVGAVLTAGERTPEGLAAKVRALCEDSEVYASCAAGSRKAAAELNWEREVRVLEGIFQPFR